jgi:hypothetical protein
LAKDSRFNPVTGRIIGGTELGCVMAHINKTKPQKALIITDGYVERPDKKGWLGISCVIEAIVSHDGTEKILERNYHIPVTRLDKF